MLSSVALHGCSATSDDTADTDTDTGTDTDTDTDTDRVALGSQGDATWTVEAWGDEGLHIGRNAVGFRVLGGDGAPVDGLVLTQAPLMDMGEMEHACPYTQPAASGNGWYESEVVFITAGMWSDTVTVSDGTRSLAYAFTDLDVAEGMGQTLTVGEQTWVVTFDIAGEPNVGANPFVLTVHAMQDSMGFPEVPDLSVDIEPSMPSMGHGSEGNVDPVYTRDGKYEGTVVFSMGGGWEVAFTIADRSGSETVVTFELEI
jgi:hypothetical protein